MSKKIQVKNSAEAMMEMATNEFPTGDELIELKNIFKRLTWGTVEITVVEGEIENVRITKNYKPVSTVDDLEEIR